MQLNLGKIYTLFTVQRENTFSPFYLYLNGQNDITLCITQSKVSRHTTSNILRLNTVIRKRI